MRLIASLVIASLAALTLAVPASAADATAELKKLAGTWVLEAITAGGTNPDPVPALKITVGGDTLRVTIDDRPVGDPNRLKLSPEFTPALIDFVNEVKKITREGIYKLDGDKLTLCLNAEPSAKQRPNEFAAPAEAGQQQRLLLVLRREKP